MFLRSFFYVRKMAATASTTTFPFKAGGRRKKGAPADLLSLSLTRAVTCGHAWPEDGSQERVRGESVILQRPPQLTYSPRSGATRSRCHEFFFTFLTTYFYSPFQMDFSISQCPWQHLYHTFITAWPTCFDH